MSPNEREGLTDGDAAHNCGTIGLHSIAQIELHGLG